jgi:pyridoxine 5-phosphate synthase
LRINTVWAIKSYRTLYRSSSFSKRLELGINAGHDLSLDNIQFFKQNIPGLLEVSIGHALIFIVSGLENVVNMYLQKIK